MFSDFLPRPWRRSPASPTVDSSSRGAPRVFVTAVWVPAARAAVFRILADIEFLPRWAAPFCERLALAGGRWLAVTALGDVGCSLEADARTGVVDLRVEPGAGRPALVVPLRVVELAGKRSLVTLSLAQAPGQSSREFARMRVALLQSLRTLADRFDDGRPRPHGDRRLSFRTLEEAPPMSFRVML